LRQLLKDISGKLVFGPTKTAKTRRVGLPRFLVGMLSDHLTGLDGGPDALVFWPGLVGVVVAASLYFFPQFSGAVLVQAGEERARQITSILDRAFRSAIADSDRQRRRP